MKNDYIAIVKMCILNLRSSVLEGSKKWPKIYFVLRPKTWEATDILPHVSTFRAKACTRKLNTFQRLCLDDHCALYLASTVNFYHSRMNAFNPEAYNLFSLNSKGMYICEGLKSLRDHIKTSWLFQRNSQKL